MGQTAARIIEFQAPVPAEDALNAAAPFARDCEIFAEGDPAECVYTVVSGVVRLVRYLDDGRRHISAFYYPGDMFGWEHGRVHRSTAEAVSACRIASVRRSNLGDLAALGGAAARRLWEAASCELDRSADHMLVLGRLTAQERVLSFLSDLAERQGAKTSIDLPMSRLDIADYLGLTIETVSRTMTQLERDGLIGLPSARRVIFQRAPERVALAAL